jgi:hypothetical protein
MDYFFSLNHDSRFGSPIAKGSSQGNALNELDLVAYFKANP